MSDGYKLDADEVVVTKLDNAQVGNDSGLDFLLTNHNAVVTKRGIFGKVKNIFVYPLNEVKIYNGRPQVGVQRKNSHLFEVRAYFSNAELVVRLDAKRKAETLANLIAGLVVGDPDAMVQQNVDLSMTQTEMMVDTVKESLGAIISPFLKSKETQPTPKRQLPEKATVKCSGCGATLSGDKGSVVVCEYCGTKNQI